MQKAMKLLQQIPICYVGKIGILKGICRLKKVGPPGVQQYFLFFARLYKVI